MFYVVYIDVLFLVNFFMDFVVLSVTGALLKIRTKIRRRVLGAALGAASYCPMLYLPREGRAFAGGALMLLSAGAMGILVFAIRRARMFCRFLIVFYASAFFLGGTVTALYHYTRLGYYLRKAVKGDLYAQMLAGVMALIVLASCMFGKIAAAAVRERRRERELYYEVELSLGERKKRAAALLDTGNHLKEPVSRKPVILMDIAFAGELLDEGTRRAVSEFYKTGLVGETGERIRLVPYHSVGKSHGLLIAVFLESLTIQMEQKAIVLKEVCAALTEEPVSARGEYQVLLNAELFIAKDR